MLITPTILKASDNGIEPNWPTIESQKMEGESGPNPGPKVITPNVRGLGANTCEALAKFPPMSVELFKQLPGDAKLVLLLHFDYILGFSSAIDAALLATGAEKRIPTTITDEQILNKVIEACHQTPQEPVYQAILDVLLSIAAPLHGA